MQHAELHTHKWLLYGVQYYWPFQRPAYALHYDMYDLLPVTLFPCQ